MILFLFIIALLGGKREILEHSLQRTLGIMFVFLLLGELLMSARVGPTQPLTGSADPQLLQQVGSAKAVGLELFSRHLVPFELASGLLLVAAVGIICLAKFPGLSIRRRTK